MKYVIYLLFSIFQVSFAGGDFYFCNKNLASLPVQKEGRVKPLGVYSKEVIKFLTTITTVGEYDHVTAFCLLSLKSLKLSNLEINIPIQHKDVKKLLQIEDRNSITGDELLNFKTKLNMEFATLALKDSYYKTIEGLLNKSFLLENIIAGNEWLIFDQNSWSPLLKFLLAQQQSGSNIPIEEVLIKSKENFIAQESDHYLLELTYQNLHLFEISMVVILLALFLLFTVKNAKIHAGLGFTALLLQIAAITFRVIISGRGPVTNMYETVVFSGTGALFVALILYLIKKDKLFLLGGFVYNLLSMFMILFANQMLDSAIKPLVPVLRDNFWLSTHVTSVTLSYGCFALSWVLANIMLLKNLKSKSTSADTAYNTKLIHLCIKVGIVLLAAGVILGGVWADYSWGRFWGWDPKETWSLIVLMIYMAILHGKMTSWIKQEKFFFWVAGAFMSVMMAWFGVNFILASGLHSYGFSQGGAIFLGTFFAIQTGFLLLVYFKSFIARNKTA